MQWFCCYGDHCYFTPHIVHATSSTLLRKGILTTQPTLILSPSIRKKKKRKMKDCSIGMHGVTFLSGGRVEFLCAFLTKFSKDKIIFPVISQNVTIFLHFSIFCSIAPFTQGRLVICRLHKHKLTRTRIAAIEPGVY